MIITASDRSYEIDSKIIQNLVVDSNPHPKHESQLIARIRTTDPKKKEVVLFQGTSDQAHKLGRRISQLNLQNISMIQIEVDGRDW